MNIFKFNMTLGTPCMRDQQTKNKLVADDDNDNCNDDDKSVNEHDNHDHDKF